MAKESFASKLLSRLNPSSGTQQEMQSAPDKQAGKMSLKMVFFILDWNKANIVTDIFVKKKVRFHFQSKALGTANSEILDLLGIGSSEKALVTCLEQEVGIPVLMKEVRKKLRSYGPGAGISFTVPLSAINDPVLLVFKQSILKNEKITGHSEKSEGENMANEYSHDLILVIVNQGYSDEIMNTARAAGARGGTIINARGTAHEGAVKFFGISVQDEKEMILILTSSDDKIAIMKAICEAHGLNSKTQGIVFSLPVDNVMGLSLE